MYSTFMLAAQLVASFVNAAFSYGGVEMVAVAAGEAEKPRKNMPKAVKRVFWRILFFYVLGSLAIGVCAASNDPNVLHGTGSAVSPWVIAIKRAGIEVLPSIIDAVVLASASSARQRLVVRNFAGAKVGARLPEGLWQEVAARATR
ncbi:Amino acid/polyamine transporter I, partial [Metarhizium hybridum]